MKSTKKVVETVTLELDQEEARWLRVIMQNPLYGQHPSEESELDASMRKKFWEALGGGQPSSPSSIEGLTKPPTVLKG